jgi:hypothetical protein
MAIVRATSQLPNHRHAQRAEQVLLHASVLAIALIVVVVGIVA